MWAAMPLPVEQLVSLLYESVLCPGHGHLFLERFAEAIRAPDGALFILTDRRQASSQILASVNVDPGYLKAYRDYYGSINVYLQRLAQTRHHPVVQPGEAICPNDELVRTEYYHDYLRPQNVFHSLGMAMELDAGLHVHLGLVRSRQRPPFGPDEIRVAEGVAAHLGLAMQVRERSLPLWQAGIWARSLLDQLPYGVLLLDRRGRLREANRYGTAVLQQRDGLRIRPGEISARLGAAIAGAGDPRHPRPSALRLPRAGQGVYDVLVMPDPQRAGILLIVTEPARDPGFASELFAQLHGLTPAEAHLCALLLEGCTLEEAGVRLQVTHHTARTHLKRILGKTGTRRQAELIRLALRSVPLAAAPLPHLGDDTPPPRD